MDFKKKYFKYKKKYLELKKQIGGTPIEINDEIKEYIKKWVSIENIVCRHGDNSPLDIGNKVGFRSFIDDSNWKGNRDKKNNVIDSCENIDLDNCEKEDRCKIYKSSKGEKCINASRIKFFEGNELAQKITGKFGDEFKLYYTYPFILKDKNEEQIEVLIYCSILVNDNDIYVLFSCGKVFNSEILYQDENLIKFKNLYTEIIKKLEGFDKLILCGHSMGCVAASFLGYVIFSDYPKTFLNKCLVIGSGSFRWLHKTDEKFNNLPNVIIFIYTRYKMDGDNDDGYVYDPAIVKELDNSNYEEEDFDLYYPIFLFNEKHGILKKIKEPDEIFKFNGDELEEIRDYFACPDDLFDCHNWNKYYNSFLQILEVKD